MDRNVVPPGRDKSSGPEIKAVYTLFLSIAFVLVNLRFYVRARILKKLWWDDFVLLLGMLFSIAAFGLVVAIVNPGFGRDIDDLSRKEKPSLYTKLDLLFRLAFFISCMFSKISICLFLGRIFVTNRVWKRVMYNIIALIVITYLFATISFLPICKPIAKLWNPALKGTCWPLTRLGVAYYQLFIKAVAIFTDFLLASLPIYFLKDVQISLRKKLSICALMSLGVFAGICAINRAVLTFQISDGGDSTHSRNSLIIWIGLEMSFAIIAAALPGIRPLWAKSARWNRRPIRLAFQSNEQQRLKPSHVVMDQQTEADSLPSRIETCITAQGDTNHGSLGIKTSSQPNCAGILKTSDISIKNYRKLDEKWISEHSSISDRERSGEDIV